jgi:O2-independent ubiquinone biosynthesis protein UbiV
MAATELTMGPLIFHWPADQKRDFWFRVADEAPIDTAYIGETICSKRTPYFDDRQYEQVAQRLERGGKKVVWSTLSEVMIKGDRKIVARTSTRPDAEVEVNDASALWHLSGRPHRIGPALNVYNEETMEFLAAKGASHFCLGPELPATTIAALSEKARQLGVGLEVQVFGRMSLALSARCYHARAHGRTKDDCRFVCEDDLDGMALTTRSNTPLLSINGIQTLSHRYLNLAHETTDLAEMGVTAFRLSPHSCDMVEVATAYRALLDGKSDAEEVDAALLELGVPQPMANGFFHHRPGLDRVGPTLF